MRSKRLPPGSRKTLNTAMNCNLPDAFKNIPSEITRAVKLLEDAGFEAYIVGGCVRDILLGKEPKDYDITTSATTGEMYRVFADYTVIPTGVKHGTLTVKTGTLFTEITTYRMDGEYKDHRHPDEVLFTDQLPMDLERRDFTINAMAYSPGKGIVDLFGGREDLSNRIIRAVGDPRKRFDEDALRILRALRFSARLDFDIEKNTAEAMLELSHSLSLISAERVFSELRGIISVNNTSRLRELFSGDFKRIIFEIIPELEPAANCLQETVFHLYTVYEHSVVAMVNIEDDPELRLTMLLHDVGKPYVKTFDENGTVHFKKHAEYGANLTGEILERLRASNNMRRKICTLVLYHEYFRTGFKEFNGSARAAAGSLLVKTGPENALLLVKVMRADLMGKNPEFTEGTSRKIDNLEAEIYNYIRAGRPLKLADLAVNGRNLKAAGIPDGKILGEVLNGLLRRVSAYETENEKELLLREAAAIYEAIRSQEDEGSGDAEKS
ncbi:MAG: HD domain-containing protein [Clostridia bacterium]|nr:HD domain-containing protein [Clostridia bacterium]